MRQTFRDLIAWQQAKALAWQIYEITRAFRNDEKFGLVVQLRRAAVSIPSNIAEGRGRRHKEGFCPLSIAVPQKLYPPALSP